MDKPPLIAVLKTSRLDLVDEREIPLEHFPDMIELEELDMQHVSFVRQFFRIGITERRAFYREGISYRME